MKIDEKQAFTVLERLLVKAAYNNKVGTATYKIPLEEINPTTKHPGISLVLTMTTDWDTDELEEYADAVEHNS